jgi:hypothetical protein
VKEASVLKLRDMLLPPEEVSEGWGFRVLKFTSA